MNTFKNILIMCHSNIGDFCSDLALVHPLREQFSQAKISVLTSTRAQPIAQEYKGLDEIITFDKHIKDKGAVGRIRLMLTLRRARYDLAIILKSTLMYKFLNISTCWSVRSFLGGLPSDVGMHVIDTYLDFLRFHGVRAKRAKFGFVSTGRDKEFAEAFLREQGIKNEDKIVGILPIANWSLKSWTMDKWNHLAKILKNEYGIKVIAFGDSDDAYFKRLVIPHVSNDIMLTGKTTLSEAIALMRRCNVFIAPDTGLLHLASIMGVKSIGLYGPSPEDYIYPYFHREMIISAKDKLDCMPCYPALTNCDCMKRAVLFSRCMERISVDDVLEGVKGALNLS